MAIYTYLVRDRDGKICRGKMIAADGKELRKKLDAQDFFLIEFEERKPKKDILAMLGLSLGTKVKYRDLSVLCWQLFTMLNAGLTLSNALKILTNQMKSLQLKGVLQDVGRQIEEGKSFSDALRGHPRVFSRFFVQMVNAGEVGGVLDDMLKKLALFYENQEQIRARLNSAMTYPVILVTVSLGVVIFMITYILPKFAEIFRQMGNVVPLPTKMLLQLGVFMQNEWFTIVSVIAAGWVVFLIYAGTNVGRYKIDQVKLNLPVFGDLLKKTIAARFTQTLATLISGGIPIMAALEVVAETLDNTAVVKVIKDVTLMVGEGKSIAAPLEESRIFPDMVIGMIRAGEETGALDQMLEKVAYFYDREVDLAIQNFTKLLEPMLIVVMTFVIGFIGVSIFTPLADLIRSIHR